MKLYLAMDVASWISFLEHNRMGLQVEVEGTKVLEVRPNGKNVDIEIHDITRLKKLRGEVKRWKE
ncbi:MAG: hypothetical protein ACE5HH_04145 [Candidatus Hydrothermarchaeales archaeon]